ncbi:type II toxin-antitoxin system HicB family antitoxin [Lichenibacterium minor]|nr:type II toxin-antitoxin system HicB family antitoxin [Lichenibacterium minor]
MEVMWRSALSSKGDPGTDIAIVEVCRGTRALAPLGAHDKFESGARGSEMKPYIGIVHHDAGSAYGVTFPDASGCFSASDTIDDVFVTAEEALGLWLETAAAEMSAIPQPRDLSVLRCDAHWVESFADAAFVIAVPSPARAFHVAA